MSGEEECSFRGTSRLDLIKNEIKHNELSHSINGPKELWPSVSNYVLNLTSPEDTNSPVAFLYFLDSGGGSYPEVISSAQAEWFNSTTRMINPDSRYSDMKTMPFCIFQLCIAFYVPLNVLSFIMCAHAVSFVYVLFSPS